MSIERRNQRTNDPTTALALLCKAVEARTQVEDLVISYESGEVFAAAASSHTSAAFAALAPIIARTSDTPARQRMFGFLNRLTDTKPAQTAFRRVATPTGAVHVAVRGSNFAARDNALRQVSAGLGRIVA